MELRLGPTLSVKLTIFCVPCIEVKFAGIWRKSLEGTTIVQPKKNLRITFIYFKLFQWWHLFDTFSIQTGADTGGVYDFIWTLPSALN